MTDQAAISAFEIWWLSKPLGNMPAPCHCGIAEEEALAIWLNAWRFQNSLKDKSWEKHL